jgi:hypothetical protein
VFDAGRVYCPLTVMVVWPLYTARFFLVLEQIRANLNSYR